MPFQLSIAKEKQQDDSDVALEAQREREARCWRWRTAAWPHGNTGYPACGVLLRKKLSLCDYNMQTLESYACEELRPSAIYHILLMQD